HPRGEARLAEEQLDELLVLGEVREDLLDHQDLFESRRALLLGEEDLPHPAGRQLLEQEILAVIAADLQLGLRYRHEFRGPLEIRGAPKSMERAPRLPCAR